MDDFPAPLAPVMRLIAGPGSNDRDAWHIKLVNSTRVIDPNG